MKRYWFLAAFGCACLSFAAVWLGGLNQDEGWYLYAANLVHEGQKVYGDFAFTQGPVMPKVYSSFTWIWAKWGLLGARAFTLALGLLGIVFAALTARKLAPEGKGNAAALIVAMLLGCNLYHLYYLAIPKTYALASLFVLVGAWMLGEEFKGSRDQGVKAFAAGLMFAFAAGVRISLGAILPVVGIALLMRRNWSWIWFGIGGMVGLALSYGMVLLDPATLKGFLAAQSYHAARGGFDPTWAVGSLSRLVRWYLPVFIVLGLAIARQVEGGRLKVGQWRGLPLLVSFLAVFVVQMAAPFPYEDYQVPIMGLLAVFAAVNFVGENGETGEKVRVPKQLLVLGLTFASSFGSPLLEKWSTNGQDRFWSLKKEKCELAQLRDAAKRIEEIDPNGKEIFTQDLYLAIETNRKVPKGLEMGPFSILSDAEWRKLISSAPCKISAVSGYTFAIEPPKCNERSFEQQIEYLKLLKEHYAAVDRIADFGQNATTLLLLKRKETGGRWKGEGGTKDGSDSTVQPPTSNLQPGSR